MIQITDAARTKIESLVAAEVVRDPALRIELDKSAGQTPLARSYAISLVERDDRQKTEIAVNVDGIRVFLNLDTSNLLSGAEIDWSAEDGGFRVIDPKARQAAAAAAAAAARGPVPEGSIAERVQAVIDELINPRIASHGGSVEMVDVSDDTLYLRMLGGCQGCAASAATLRMGIERMVQEEIPEIREIVDVTDHTAGVNPYY
ncbi:MAG TPA: NifU family protein [Longimicrobiaceae bacterium]|jgi:Fe/S biogenesis protein NfuA|nr:NifU family protein [Longimicrobiaceae bacterium]